MFEHRNIKMLPGATCVSAEASVNLPFEGLAVISVIGSRLSTKTEQSGMCAPGSAGKCVLEIIRVVR